MSSGKPSWKDDGVQVARGDQLDPAMAQSLGMKRLSAITHAPPGVDTLAAATVEIRPGAGTPPHHHGPLESVICVVEGRARLRWGNALEFTATAEPGDFIFIPPWVPHQEQNGSRDEALRFVLIRDEEDPVVVLLDIAAPDGAVSVPWIDAHHPGG